MVRRIKSKSKKTKKILKRGGSNSKKVIIKKSTNPKKKYMAVFYENDKRIKTTHFGCAGMSDYTKHKDKERRHVSTKT